MYEVDWSRTSRSQSYITVYCPVHPRAWGTGYIYAHRVVMELHLGRYLTANEVVHHKDGNKQNNAISNLELLSNEDHSREHNVPLEPLSLVCPCCGKGFQRKRNQRASVKGYKLAFCSRSCSGKYYKKVARARGEEHIIPSS